MTDRNLVIINTVVIASLIVIRFIVFGWILLALGIVVILPITILHLIATNRGFKKYSKIFRPDRIILWISFISFIIFILFQYEIDDRAGYMVIEAWLRKYWIGYEKYQYDFSNISFLLSIITGLVIIGADVYIIMRLKKLKNGSTQQRV